MNLGIELGRDVSVAGYLKQRLDEMPLGVDRAVVADAVEAAAALEVCELARAARYWAKVVREAERIGREARRQNVPMRRLMLRLDRLRDAIDLVLFDGWLPAELAAQAARTTARMSALALERAMLAYWSRPRTSPTELKKLHA